MHENVISYIQDLPKELDLHKHVDYDLQFEKAFLEPIKVILNCIGWETERKNTLESFFSWHVTLYAGQMTAYFQIDKWKSLNPEIQQTGLPKAYKRSIMMLKYT